MKIKWAFCYFRSILKMFKNATKSHQIFGLTTFAINFFLKLSKFAQSGHTATE